MAGYFNFNGSILPATENIIGPGNRAFRYGEGVFETIRVCGDSIPLLDLHINRAVKGLYLLGFNIPPSFDRHFFSEQIQRLNLKNNHGSQVRIRLAFFGGDKPLYSINAGDPDFVIQSWDLPDAYHSFNKNGLSIGVFPDAIKSPDKYSHLKSNNYLPYLTGAAYAKKMGLDDALILNPHSRIADAYTANIFWIRENEIFTPPLSEGAVAGVMREWLLKKLPENGFSVNEKELTSAELEKADEVFLTNALYGLRWVQHFNSKVYTGSTCNRIYKNLIGPLFATGI